MKVLIIDNSSNNTTATDIARSMLDLNSNFNVVVVAGKDGHFRQLQRTATFKMDDDHERGCGVSEIGFKVDNGNNEIISSVVADLLADGHKFPMKFDFGDDFLDRKFLLSPRPLIDDTVFMSKSSPRDRNKPFNGSGKKKFKHSKRKGK